jgi:hypothetical protein
VSDIFISHIHEDAIAANALKRFIEAKLRPRMGPSFGTIPSHGPNAPKIFLSSTELKLGDDFLDKIRAALRSSKIVLALFSDEAVTRPWVHFEAGGAWFSVEKTLIPLCIGGLDPARLPKPYSNIQSANLHDRSAPCYLIEAVWRILAPSPVVPPPFPPSDSDVVELGAELERWRKDRDSIRELLDHAMGAGDPNE